MTWTLRKKILIGYGIALALMCVVLAWGMISLRTLGSASEAILKENYWSIQAAENMIDAVERQNSATLLMILGHRDEGRRQFRVSENQFHQWLVRAGDNITIEGEANIIEAINDGYTDYLVNIFELERFRREEPDAVAEYYRDEIMPTFAEVREECVRLRQLNQETMFSASDRARDISRRSRWSMGVIGVGAVGVGLAFSLILSTLILKPLRRIMAAAQKVSDGDYGVRVATATSDELGHLASEFNSMVNKLKVYNDLNVRQIVEEKGKSEAIIRSIDDGVIVVDSDGKIININPTARRVLQIDEEALTGRHFLEVVKSEELFQYIKEALQTGRPPMIDERKRMFPLKFGEEEKHFLFSITPAHARTGGMIGVVLLLRDVTQMRELDRLKSEFVMSASHELRTPLTSIAMSVNLLKESASEKLSEQEQELLNAAHEELERIKALVNDLLDLSRIEAGKVEMAFDKVSPSLLVEKAVSALKVQAKEKGVALESEIADDLPEVKADPNKITWVLTNLIANALRYTESGGKVKLSGEKVGGQVHLFVADTGTGIPPEFQSRIFDKFVQVSGRSSGGAGLGLAICKEIVRAHGGTIWVESEVDKGSVFVFTLPIAE